MGARVVRERLLWPAGEMGLGPRWALTANEDDRGYITSDGTSSRLGCHSDPTSLISYFLTTTLSKHRPLRLPRNERERTARRGHADGNGRTEEEGQSDVKFAVGPKHGGGFPVGRGKPLREPRYVSARMVGGLGGNDGVVSQGEALATSNTDATDGGWSLLVGGGEMLGKAREDSKEPSIDVLSFGLQSTSESTEDDSEQGESELGSEEEEEWSEGRTEEEGQGQGQFFTPNQAVEEDPWGLSKEERVLLVEHWRTQEMESASEDLQDAIERFNKAKKELDEHRSQADLAVLKGVDILGMTTTGVAMHQDLVKALGVAIVIVEEAAEVLEGHILTTLTEATQQLILIGDHLQLRPKSEVYQLTVDSGRGHDLDMSMFERLVHEGRVPVQTLSTQRRMRPCIADLIRPAVYPNLADAPTVLEYPNVKGMRDNLFFLDHNVLEDDVTDSVINSKTNRHEANLVCGLTQYLLKQGYTKPGDITVLTPYLGQLLVLREIFARSSVLQVEVSIPQPLNVIILRAPWDMQVTGRDGQELSKMEDDLDLDDQDNARPLLQISQKTAKELVRIATVDNFQGEEAKIIIVSLVRSNKNLDMGFLRSSNRVNVLLSRAMHGMYIVGNAVQACCGHGSPVLFRETQTVTYSSGMLQARKRTTIWSESVLPTLQASHRIGSALELKCALHPDTVTRISRPEDFAAKVGDGGCNRSCNFRLPCGHACHRRCHPDDIKHLTGRCIERCLRLLQPCGHPCDRLCGEDCGECSRVIPKVALPCGHDAVNDPGISTAPKRQPRVCRHRCNEPSTVTVPGCGHKVAVGCTAGKLLRQNPELCKKRCSTPLECGHNCAANCGECRTLTRLKRQGKTVHPKCQVVCGRPQHCGHSCRQPCHSGTACIPCPAPCMSICQHSRCGRQCWEPCVPCAEPCTWSCSHRSGQCRLPCGAPCLRLPCDKRCDQKLACGHRCPCVCGEDCPDESYCRECGKGAHMDHVVDMIEFKTLREFDPDDEPLVVLRCGHAYGLTTIDNHMDLKEVYRKDQRSNEWLGPRPLTANCSRLKLCPDCRQPIDRINRYKRVINTAKASKGVDMAQVKHVQWCRSQNESARRILALAEGETLDNRRCRQAHAQRILDGVLSCASPMTQVHEAALAMLHQKGAESEELAKGTVSRLRPDMTPHVDAFVLLGKLETLRLRETTNRLNQVSNKMLGPIDLACSEVLLRKSWERVTATNYFASGCYSRGIALFGKAIDVAVSAKAAAAEAGAQVGLAQINLHAAQYLALLKDVVIWSPIHNSSAEMLKDSGKHMVQRGLEACKRAANSPLESARHKYEGEVRDTRKGLDVANDILRAFISKEEIHVVKEVLFGKHTGSIGVTRYYTCPNGHIYGVGDCGMRNERGTCNECGAVIGGL
ncbi:unnamed protein product [Discosporangium mesarthrocarpum]